MNAQVHRSGTLSRFIRPLLLAWLIIAGTALVTQAQSCTGGPPELTVDETFGRVGSPSSLSNRTRYQFTTITCPLDGEYALADHVDGTCYNNLWYAVPQDHTPGDARGLMMIVNGSRGAGEVYTQPATGLCGQTTYEFSLWGINLLRPGICTNPLLPNLTLRVEAADGTILQSIDFGSIPQSSSPTWQRFSTLFTTPGSTQGVVIKLINNQGDDGCGNDMAIDDVQVRQCTSCPPSPVFIPDAFTPNNDGTNDVLRVFATNVASFTMTVFDRWGSPIFYTNTTDRCWDGVHSGQPCAPGSYSWLLTYQQVGANPTNAPIVQRGQVMLTR